MSAHETVTPSGFSIVFEDGAPDPQTGKAKRRSYTVDGEKLVAVSTVLGMLDKPGLPWAAEKLTVAAAIELAKAGELPLNVPGALSRMGARELRFRQVWNKKATRGTVSHEDLVRLAKGEDTVDVDGLPSEQRAFVRGVAGFYADERPEFSEFEVPVACPEYGFAGTHDLYGLLPRVHPTAKCLCDLKTTESLPRDKAGNVKAPYQENLIQLGLYELGRRASGYEPSDYQAVLRVDATGAYDLFSTVVDLDVAVVVVNCYRALKGLSTKPVELMEVAA